MIKNKHTNKQKRKIKNKNKDKQQPYISLRDYRQILLLALNKFHIDH